MAFSFWLILGGGTTEGQEGLRLSIELRPLDIRTIRPFGTAHSSTSTRTNAFVKIRLDSYEGLSEVGLPPFKPGIYEGTYSDCESLAVTYASLLVNAFGKRVTSWFSSHSPTESLVWEHQDKHQSENESLALYSKGRSDREQLYCTTGTRMIDVLDYCMTTKKHPRSAFSLIETAILKCLSECLRVPISTLLGMDSPRTSINCFYTVGITDDMTELIENIRYGKSHTSFIKLKVDKDLSKAMHVMHLLEKEGMLSRSCKTIAIDANCSWTPQIAIQFLDDFRDYMRYIYMVEQPFPFSMPFFLDGSEDASQWQQVKAAFESKGIDIYADESMRTSNDVQSLLPFCHGVNIKLEKTGGFREAARAQRLCKGAGINVWLGCMVGTALNCNSIVEILPLCNSAADMDGFLLTSPECQPCKANFHLSEEDKSSRGNLYGTIIVK